MKLVERGLPKGSGSTIRRRLSGTIASSALLASASAAAPLQALAQGVPGVTNPGLQQQQELEQWRQRQLPEVQREPTAPLLTPPSEGEAAPKPADDPELLINRVEVQGARVISAERIQAVFAPLLSPADGPKPVRFSQLQEALNKASNLYRDAGFFTSRLVIPNGGLDRGVLTVVAVEGFIEKVEVLGRGSQALKRWAQFYASPLVSSAEQPRPIRFTQLERQLLLMQGFGGVRFNSTLTQGQSFAGSKLVLEMDPDYSSGSISVDNNVQPQLGTFQLSGQLQGNVLNSVQPLQLNAYGSNGFPYGGGIVSGGLSFATPVGNRGLRLVGLGNYTNTNSTATPLNVGGPTLDLTSSGNSWLGNLALRYPLLISRTGSLTVSLAGEMQNTTSNSYLDGVMTLANPSRLRVLRMGLEGTLSTPFYASNANLRISQGLPIANAFDADTLSQTNSSLPSGSVAYTSARLTLTHQQRLGGSNSFITLTGSGQITGNVLPSPEDFAYGGQFLGRAYRGTYLIGDKGISGGVELSHAFYSGAWAITPFVFADVGSASNNGGVPIPANYQAYSYGLGLRGGWSNATSWEAGWAIPGGSYPTATNSAGAANSIVYFRASLQF